MLSLRKSSACAKPGVFLLINGQQDTFLKYPAVPEGNSILHKTTASVLLLLLSKSLFSERMLL